ncbi:hypothetical protein GCM10027160_52230 [Streptomyces calidiresistens]|uniref:Uncharacterized protein n=1 Tax=Streptomyces calidiresistens TaxID=1485586 RepID=A0A7W3T1T8_9ACTN|nr:hypothetical protein [Streptomyces calidiresistens]MBB0229382.1 hypothetical protein [Streptomyces calidiresistens]
MPGTACTTVRTRLVSYVNSLLTPTEWPHADAIADQALALAAVPTIPALSPDTDPVSGLPASLARAVRTLVRQRSTAYLARLDPAPLTRAGAADEDQLLADVLRAHRAVDVLPLSAAA